MPKVRGFYGNCSGVAMFAVTLMKLQFIRVLSVVPAIHDDAQRLSLLSLHRFALQIMIRSSGGRRSHVRQQFVVNTSAGHNEEKQLSAEEG